MNFSAPEVETEKEKPAPPKHGFESVEFFGSKSSAASAPTEDQKKNKEPCAGLFNAKPTSEALTTAKPAVNLFGSSSSNVPKSDVPRRSSRKTATQIANERKELWERYLLEERIDG